MPNLDRYSRQVLLPPIGAEGQARIGAATAVIVGCGALGTVSANLLARAGVGRLRIVDRDFVEESNLQRQVLFDEDDCRAHLPKAAAAEQKLRRINSRIEVSGIVSDLNFANIEELFAGATVIVDGTDNFETRFLVNDACVKLGLPWVYGGAVGTSGMVLAIVPGVTPCLRCIFETMPPPGSAPTCETAGVLGPLTGVIGALQACEALKLCAGRREALNPHLVSLDLWSGEMRQLNVAKAAEAADCPACKRRQFEFLAGAQASSATSLCGRHAVQINPRRGARVELSELAARLKAAGIAPLAANAYLVKFNAPSIAGDLEVTVFPDSRAIVKGTRQANEARAVYTKYIGL